ncbi:MAG: hypothetical protein HY647_07190 [Acidobacteria bacterium]|nr:hypothetical protein [Acidobacteriota bacterium]
MEPEAKAGERFARKGHSLEVVVEARALEKQHKGAQVTLVQPAGRTFTLECDEGAYLNGDDTAPPPLSFLTSSIAF